MTAAAAAFTCRCRGPCRPPCMSAGCGRPDELRPALQLVDQPVQIRLVLPEWCPNAGLSGELGVPATLIRPRYCQKVLSQMPHLKWMTSHFPSPQPLVDVSRPNEEYCRSRDAGVAVPEHLTNGNGVADGYGIPIRSTQGARVIFHWLNGESAAADPLQAAAPKPQAAPNEPIAVAGSISVPLNTSCTPLRRASSVSRWTRRGPRPTVRRQPTLLQSPVTLT